MKPLFVVLCSQCQFRDGLIMLLDKTDPTIAPTIAADRSRLTFAIENHFDLTKHRRFRVMIE